MIFTVKSNPPLLCKSITDVKTNTQLDQVDIDFINHTFHTLEFVGNLLDETHTQNYY